MNVSILPWHTNNTRIIYFLLLTYLGMFIPPNGLNIGLNWSMISSLDHSFFLV